MKDKHFDLCIMNPPYSGSLHLRILERVIPIADEVVNISPIRWLQDPTAFMKKRKTDMKKYEDSILKHLVALEPVDFNSVFPGQHITMPGVERTER